jgi:redox-sensitive bicupin YhaK (pirin superfamily)
MTNTEAGAELDLCPEHPAAGRAQVLRPRLVPLGGPRAMTVRRTLPHRDRSFVGAWCFVDHYGPDQVATSGGMDVPPHPHTGLQTVSWLFEGQIEHRDSGGVHAIVTPGEVNLMTGGDGIAHSEVSTAATTSLHGVQLWVVLPTEHRGAPREFQHHAAPLVELAPGVRARVFVGDLAGHRSPVRTFTALLGAEVHLDAGATWTPVVEAGHEHALLVDEGAVAFCGTELAAGELGTLDTGHDELTVAARRPTRAVLLGGAPFEEEVVMWWNFIAAGHDEIRAAREQWESHSDRFGEVAGYAGPTRRLAAPPLPGVRLRPRGRRGGDARRG